MRRGRRRWSYGMSCPLFPLENSQPAASKPGLRPHIINMVSAEVSVRIKGSSRLGVFCESLMSLFSQRCDISSTISETLREVSHLTATKVKVSIFVAAALFQFVMYDFLHQWQLVHSFAGMSDTRSRTLGTTSLILQEIGCSLSTRRYGNNARERKRRASTTVWTMPFIAFETVLIVRL